MYSTIKKKKCKCGCNKYPSIGYNGFHNSCAPAEIKEVQDAKTKRQRSKANKAKLNKVRSLYKPEQEKDNMLELFYMAASVEIAKHPYCMETGEYISKNDYRNSTAHIFPKSIFRSISHHPLNYLILSNRNGSHDKTHRLDTFSKMKVWVIACERFKILEPLITEKHKYLNTFKDLVLETLKN